MTGLTRAAIVMLLGYLVVRAVFAIGDLGTDGGSDLPSGWFAAVALLQLPTMIATVVVVACWIYRSSANAHAIDGDLTITPGWAVGWYFVPFASLVMPLRAMKETWLASHYGSDWGRAEAGDLLNWWWGLWLLGNILSTMGAIVHDTASGFAYWMQLASAVVDLPTTLLLVRIMQRIRDAQRVIIHAEAFA